MCGRPPDAPHRNALRSGQNNFPPWSQAGGSGYLSILLLSVSRSRKGASTRPVMARVPAERVLAEENTSVKTAEGSLFVEAASRKGKQEKRKRSRCRSRRQRQSERGEGVRGGSGSGPHTHRSPLQLSVISRLQSFVVDIHRSSFVAHCRVQLCHYGSD